MLTIVEQEAAGLDEIARLHGVIEDAHFTRLNAEREIARLHGVIENALAAIVNAEAEIARVIEEGSD